MELKHLDTFIQVAELSSFTKAAEKLGYSQSTISFQIKQLETSLNAQLFERINHTVVLTSRGEEVLRYAHQISKLAQEMKEIPDNSKKLEGHIRIAMSDSLCTWILENNFDAFRRQYPGITLTIISASTEEMFRLLNQNEVDMVYTLDSHIYDHNYIIASEEKVDTHFVIAADFMKNFASPSVDNEKISEPATLNDLLSCPFILTEKGMSYRRLMDEKLASMSLEIRPVLEIGNTKQVSKLVEQGIGVSFLPDFVTQKAVSAGKIKHLTIEGFEIDIWKQLLYHRGKWVSAEMKAVMDYLSRN